MAAEGDANKDLRAHQGTYAAFTGLMKWGAIHCIVILIILAIVYNSFSDSMAAPGTCSIL